MKRLEAVDRTPMALTVLCADDRSAGRRKTVARAAPPLKYKVNGGDGCVYPRELLIALRKLQALDDDEALWPTSSTMNEAAPCNSLIAGPHERNLQ
jgi:hypothetical protein